MPTQDKKVSILLSSGIDNRSMDELVAPVVTPGAAPTLKQSTNTRLGVIPGGVARSPLATAITAPSEPDKIRAILSSSSGKSTLLLPGPDGRGLPVFLADAGRQAGITYSFLGSSQNRNYQTDVLPTQVVSSENVGSAKSVSQFAVSYNATTGRLWFAYLTGDGVTGPSAAYTPQDWVMVGVATPDGVIASTPAMATQLAQPASRWIGMTSHGANGDRVWYVNDAGAICYRPVVCASGSVVIPSAEVVVVTPGAASPGIDVCRIDDTFACLVHSRSGTPADGTVRKVNVTTGATATSVNITNALNGGGYCAVASASPEGNLRIVAAFASTTAVTAVSYLYDSSLTQLQTHTPISCNGRVSVGFDLNDAGSDPGITPLVSLCVEIGSAIQSAVVRLDPMVALCHVDTSTGILSVQDYAAWARIGGHAAQWVISNQLMFTIHQVVPRYATSGDGFGGSNYVDDPSLDLFWSRGVGLSPTILTQIARLGVVRGTSAPVDHLYADKVSSSSMICVGDDLHVMYRLLSDFSSVASGLVRGRHSVVRLSAPAGQLASAHDRDGCGLLAAALPIQWDGQSIVELGGPLHTPALFADVVAAGGTVLAAGVYSYQAVLYWTDASGLTHRSRPSKLRTITANGTTDRVFLLAGIPKTLVPFSVEARIYATEANGTSLHLMAVLPTRSSFASFNMYASAVTAASAQIYSSGGNGEEIVPQPPPPAWDISVIMQRCWIVDAEQRSRAVHSKIRIAGVGYEFTPAFEVILSSGGGAIMAVREWQGLVLFLTERAVYQVSGEGPGNTLGASGGSYSTPVKISDLGCSNRSSVVICPAGILWQFGARFVMLGPNGVSYVAGFQATHDVSAAVCLTRYAEVLFFSATTPEVRVYHYESGKWTTWDTQTLPELVQAAHVLPYDPDIAVLALGSGPSTFKRFDANTTGSPTNMVFETDWILLGGDFQDHVLLRDVVFNGYIVGAHDIRVELFLDYQSTSGAASTDRSWTATQLSAIAVNGYYSVRLEPQEENCRAVKLRVLDTVTSGAGCRPRSLTVVYAVDGILREDAFFAGSRQ